MRRVYVPVLAVVGVGLIGGSFSLALKEAGVVGQVIGVDSDAENLEKALSLNLVDVISPHLDAVANADVVVLATPVQVMKEIVGDLTARMKKGAVLTDCGSVKAEIVHCIESVLPESLHYVPGHPISGTEKSGAEAAFSTLFKERRCILSPTMRTDPAALNLVRQLWEAAGSEVVLMDIEKHDRVLAAISHLPHMVAYSLVNAVGSYDKYKENLLHYSAGGFKDFTRIASSDPVMWRDIALTNREAILEMIDLFSGYLTHLRDDVEAGNGEDLLAFFQSSKNSRDAIL